MPSSIQNLLLSSRLRRSLHRSTEAFLRSVKSSVDIGFREVWLVKLDGIMCNFNSNFNRIMRKRGKFEIDKHGRKNLKLFSAALERTDLTCQTCASTGGTCYSDADDALACGCPMHYRATNGLTDGCDQIYGKYAPSIVPRDHVVFRYHLPQHWHVRPSISPYIIQHYFFILHSYTGQTFNRWKRCLCGSYTLYFIAYTGQTCNRDGSVVCVDPNAECTYDTASCGMEFSSICNVGYVSVTDPVDPSHSFCGESTLAHPVQLVFIGTRPTRPPSWRVCDPDSGVLLPGASLRSRFWREWRSLQLGESRSYSNLPVPHA